MKTMKKCVWLLLAMCLSMSFVACSDSDDPVKPEVKPETEAYQEEEPYANFFGYNVMNDVYLWKQDITSALNAWDIEGDPARNVGIARYKDNGGADIDQWTMMTDSYTEMVGGANGESSGTYGCNYQLYLKAEGSDDIVAFVTYTSPDSPAEKAGLKRGDVVLEINGKTLDKSNYTDLYYSASMTVGVGKYLGKGAYSAVEKTVSMQAVAMYENPVLLSKVFDCGGKKVGYLVYTSFTFESSLALVDVCREFKKEGITELILDLRYNGGGYVFTENVLASMLAPADVVQSKSVLSTEVWNDDYMAYYKREKIDLNTYFQTKFKQSHNNKEYNIDTSDANLGLTKIYAIVDSGTASASESILVCLMPYMDIEVIGGRTHGKYCSGIMLKGADWYQDVVDNYKDNGKNFGREHPEFADWKRYIADWGIYVMISMYADKDGNNPCMPEGLVPDVEAEDLVEESYPLGDEREAMLNVALQRAGKTDVASRASSRSVSSFPSGREIRVNRGMLEGRRIVTDGLAKSRLVK